MGREDSRDVFESMCTIIKFSNDRALFEAVRKHLGLEYNQFILGLDLEMELLEYWDSLSLPDRKEFLERMNEESQ